MGKFAVFGGMLLGLAMCISANRREPEPEQGYYTSPRVLHEQKMLDISNRTGVPLEDVRAYHADEGRIATERTLRGR